MDVESQRKIANSLEQEGYALLPRLFSPEEASSLGKELTAALQKPHAQVNGTMATATGIYAARNVMNLWPNATTIWRRTPLQQLLGKVLSERFGLVRVLFFDKPPNRTWALPWHKDLTIAVRSNQVRNATFSKPTTKAGVPHVEAPISVLAEMLTVRVHLDDVTEENGPLRVLPGSHRSGKEMVVRGSPESILATAGDALLMRPLLMHCSNQSQPETLRHRRILHFEFAATETLPDGYEWYSFVAGRS